MVNNQNTTTNNETTPVTVWFRANGELDTFLATSAEEVDTVFVAFNVCDVPATTNPLTEFGELALNNPGIVRRILEQRAQRATFWNHCGDEFQTKAVDGWFRGVA